MTYHSSMATSLIGKGVYREQSIAGISDQARVSHPEGIVIALKPGYWVSRVSH